MRDFDYIKTPESLPTLEIVQMVAGIHEHKGNFMDDRDFSVWSGLK
ncbi:MAG: hypothetical protein J1E98_08910 [Lachnospiraceae bacterium]|nr:hypothetical protein [Lachnospiraceae bacterium]